MPHIRLVLLALVVPMTLFGCSDDGKEAECGNNVIEAGEDCDGTAMPDKSCRDFGFSGGTLGCSNCALVMTGCLDCGGADPCAGATCSGHGTCRLDVCEPWCECEAGYLPGYGLECREEGTCLGLGEECRFPLDCCLGSCIKLGYDTTGRCGMLGCTDDAHCASLAPEGATTCCMEHFDVTACQAVAAGETCGDRSGGCGTPCSGQFQSACAPGLTCVLSNSEDPYAVCAAPCSSDADCLGCADPADSGREFSCQTTGDGSRYCLAKPIECERNQDCPDGLVCGVRDNAGMTGLVGNCLRSGAQNTGEECTFWGHYYSGLAYDERCASEYCWFGHCSELCLTDADCPQGMYCTLLIGYGETRKELMPFCVRMQGSETPCSSTGDCPAGEVCAYNELTPEGVFSKVCKAPNCDPAQPDCLGSGEFCDQGSPPCWDGFCFKTGSQFCSAFCEGTPDCPRGMICGHFKLAEGPRIGICFPHDGSADACGSDADCTEDGEVCAYYLNTPAGVETLCSNPRGEGLPGEPCDDVACASGLCMGNIATSYCSTPCLVEADCPDSYVCFTIVDQVHEPFPACATAPGSLDPCTGDLDCASPDEVCMPIYPWQQPMEGRCLQGIPGGAGAGESCGDDMNCFSFRCLFGTCSAQCFTNPDCALYGMECKAALWEAQGVVPSCLVPGADSPLCTLCAADADCGVANARCITSLANPGEKYCGKPCAGAADCPGGHSCVDVGGVSNCKPDTDTCVPQ